MKIGSDSGEWGYHDWANNSFANGRKVNPLVKETSFFAVGALAQQHHLSSNHFSLCFYAHEPQVWGIRCKCQFYWKQKSFCKIIAKQLSRIQEELVSPVEIVLYSHLETFGRGTRKDRWTLGLYRNLGAFSFSFWLTGQWEAGSTVPGVKGTLYTQLWSNTPPLPLFRKKSWELKSPTATFSGYLKWCSSFNKGCRASTKQKQNLFLHLMVAPSLSSSRWCPAWRAASTSSHPHSAIPAQQGKDARETHNLLNLFLCIPLWMASALCSVHDTCHLLNTAINKCKLSYSDNNNT